MDQKERINVYSQFKENKVRILVATDLVGRGIDVERVNIVINYDMPVTDDMHGNGAGEGAWGGWVGVWVGWGWVGL